MTINPMIAKKLTDDDKRIVLNIMGNPLTGCYKHPDFYRPTKADEIMGAEIPEISAEWYARMLSGDKTSFNNKKNTLLTPEQESRLFKRYNYARFKIGILRAKVKKQQKGNVVKLLEWYRELAKVEDVLCKANLSLAVSIVGCFRTQVDWSDMIEESSTALLEAVRKFDYTRNLKFSTFAFRVIRNTLITYFHNYKKIVKNEIQVSEEGSGFDYIECCYTPRPYSGKMTDLIAAVVEHNIAELSETEIEVLRGRYPMDGSQRVTLKVLAKQFGRSIPSIVRVEEISFSKLRVFLSENANKFGISEEIL